MSFISRTASSSSATFCMPMIGPKLSSIPETDGVPEAREMIRLLVEGQEAVVRTARSIFPLVDKAADEPSADLLTQRMQVHEKTAWMLRALLEK